MKDIDFSECRFIRDELRFLFYKDFCKDCFIIKKEYKKLTSNGKIFYKYFVYANIYMTLQQKNTIWEFLNNEGIEYYDTLIAIRK